MPRMRTLTPVTGIEPAILRFRRNSPQIGLTPYISHIFYPITPASEHLPSNVKSQQLRKHNPYQGVPREDRVFRETFLRNIGNIRRILLLE
jgi:hypothetical protein